MGDDVVRYTTASDSYDEFGTRTVEPSCRQWQGAVVRGVTIPPDGLTWQVMRYESGLYSVWERLDDIPGGA